jgi:multiple antibiotic resistance protein
VSEFVRAAVGMFAAVAPLGALPVFLDARVSAEDRPRVLAMMFVTALLLLGAAAMVAQPFLDWLDISPENFQLAAGIIMLPQAVQLLWRGRTLSESDKGAIVPLAIPLLAGPASLAAAMSYGTRFGEADAIGASAAVLMVTSGLLLAGDGFQRRVGGAVIGVLARLNGALLVVIAIELAVDGVRSV